ncbi:MAG: Do family serine endopeptidase [Acidobacteriia bacterium]|nr:Do family serine endopeptidase [Terriglobia bacterium]
MEPFVQRIKNHLSQKAFLSWLIVFSTLAMGILIGTLITVSVRADKKATDASPLTIPAPKQLSSQFSQVAKTVEPSVVNITADIKIKPRTMHQRGNGDPNQGEPFDFFHFMMPDQSPEGFVEPVSGSGFIVDKKGYIITNQHVVNDAERITVKLANGDVYRSVKLIGTDSETDLAVLKIEPKTDLPIARFGNSESANVGDWVLAVGSPFGLDQTLTAGIISAKNRDQIDSGQFKRFIQTDAVINPGNSGGPLINMDAEVIGINTSIATNTGVWQGYGFALPSNTAINVYNQIIEHGRVERGSIGISHQGKPQTPVVLRSFGVTDGKGVVIENVEKGGPADKAGLRRGDVIRTIDQKPITNWDDLVQVVADTPVNKTVPVQFFREGSKQTAQVTIRDRCEVFPDRCGEVNSGVSNEKDNGQSKLGMSIQNISAQIAQQMKLKDTDGVLVTKIEPGTVADEVGLQRMDVILEINREAVHNISDYRKIEAKLKPGDDVMFLYSRQGANTYVGTTLQ